MRENIHTMIRTSSFCFHGGDLEGENDSFFLQPPVFVTGDNVGFFLQYVQDVQVGGLQDHKKPAHGVHPPQQRAPQTGGA